MAGKIDERYSETDLTGTLGILRTSQGGTGSSITFSGWTNDYAIVTDRANSKFIPSTVTKASLEAALYQYDGTTTVKSRLISLESHRDSSAIHLPAGSGVSGTKLLSWDQVTGKGSWVDSTAHGVHAPTYTVSDATKHLSINSAGNGLTWVTPPIGVPTYAVGDATKILTVNAAGNGLTWSTPSAVVSNGLGNLTYTAATDVAGGQTVLYVTSTPFVNTAGVNGMIADFFTPLAGTLNLKYRVNLTDNAGATPGSVTVDGTTVFSGNFNIGQVVETTITVRANSRVRIYQYSNRSPSTGNCAPLVVRSSTNWWAQCSYNWNYDWVNTPLPTA